MADANLRFILSSAWKGEGVRQGAQDLQNMGTKGTGATRSLVGGFTELNSMLSLARQGVGQLKQVYAQTIGVSQEYAFQVRDLARITGESAESTSVLIQAADDARISYEAVTTAARMMVRQGIQPSTESIAALADKYNELTDPLEKNRLLLSTFGRAGLQMGKLLERGSEGISQSADAAKRLGLVIGQDVLDNAQQWYDVQDELNDIMTGAKITVGNFLVGGLLPYIRLLKDARVIVDAFSESNNALIKTWGWAINAMMEVNPLLQSEAERVRDAAEATDELGAAARSATPEFDPLGEELTGLTEAEKAAEQQLERTNERLRQQAADVRDAARAFDTANLGLADMIEGWMDLNKFLAAGGGGLGAVANQAVEAFQTGNINLGEMNGILEEVQISTLQLQMELDLISTEEAQEQAQELGVALDIPRKTVADIREHLESLKDKTVTVTIRQVVQGHEQGVGGPGGFQHGGVLPAKGVAEVGEAGTEGVINGVVVPHALWEKLKALGLMPGRQMLAGGSFEKSQKGSFQKTSPESKEFLGTTSATEAFGGGGMTPIAPVAQQLIPALSQEIQGIVSPLIQASTAQVEVLVQQQVASTQQLTFQQKETNEKLDILTAAVLSRASDTGVAGALQKADFR